MDQVVGVDLREEAYSEVLARGPGFAKMMGALERIWVKKGVP